MFSCLARLSFTEAIPCRFAAAASASLASTDFRIRSLTFSDLGVKEVLDGSLWVRSVARVRACRGSHWLQGGASRLSPFQGAGSHNCRTLDCAGVSPLFPWLEYHKTRLGLQIIGSFAKHGD